MPNPVINRRILAMRSSGGGSGICAAGTTFANAWAARVVANGGAAPLQATKNAIATFHCGLITDGLDTQMIGWNVFVSDSLLAATTPQLLVGADPWVNHGFVLGDLSANGITGNASNKYLDTGYSIEPARNASFGVVRYVYTANASGFEYGAYNGGAGVLGAAKHTDNNAYSYSGVIGANAITVASPGNGFYSAQRVSATDHRLYFATSLSPHAQIGATDSTASVGNLGGVSHFVMAVSLSGATQFICSDTLSFIGYTSGLSAADDAKLFLRVQALRTALGGGFR